MARKNRYTVYDAMEDRGVFDQNPANAQSNFYRGPVEYPRMLYHPKGEKRMVVREEKVPTPLGIVTVPAQYELINRTVGSLEEEEEWVQKGWHHHPGEAMAAAGENRPEAGPPIDEDAIKKQIAQLQAKLASSRRAPLSAKVA